MLSIFRSTDASAPQLTATAGSLITVLRACLVSGYGSKLPAGWTEPFSVVNNTTVFRPSTPGASFLQVTDSSTTLAVLQGYEVALSSIVGRVGFPVQELARPLGNTSGTMYPVSCQIPKSVTPWVVLADETTVYILVSNPAGWLMAGFGKLADHAANDPNPWYCFGLRSAETLTSLFETYRCGFTWHNTSNLSNFQCMGLGRGYLRGSPGHAYPCRNSYPVPVNAGGGRNLKNGTLSVIPVDIYEFGTSAVIRGRLPGLVLPRQLGPDWTTTFSEGQVVATGPLSLVRFSMQIFGETGVDVLFDLAGVY